MTPQNRHKKRLRARKWKATKVAQRQASGQSFLGSLVAATVPSELKPLRARR